MRAGYSLVEFLVVAVIAAIVLASSYQAYINSQKRDSLLTSAFDSIELALEPTAYLRKDIAVAQEFEILPSPATGFALTFDAIDTAGVFSPANRIEYRLSAPGPCRRKGSTLQCQRMDRVVINGVNAGSTISFHDLLELEWCLEGDATTTIGTCPSIPRMPSQSLRRFLLRLGVFQAHTTDARSHLDFVFTLENRSPWNGALRRPLRFRNFQN